MPGVPGLAIGVYQFLHQRVFGHFRNARRDQLARFHLMHMAVPQRFLGRGQGVEQLLTDDVFDPHQLGILAVAIVDHTLDHLVVEDRAVMVSFHLHIWVAVVEMEAIQVSVQRIDRRA